MTYSKHEHTRKKHQKVKCPYCGATSNVTSIFDKTSQFRKCKNGHDFVYDYHLEYINQDRTNYKQNHDEKNNTQFDVLDKEIKKEDNIKPTKWSYANGDGKIKKV